MATSESGLSDIVYKEACEVSFKVRKILLVVMSFVILLSAMTVYGASPPVLDSPAAILVEQSTGRVLYAREERERMYPAGLTSMLTALVALDFLDLDEAVRVGPEIRGMPAGFTTNVHVEDEIITVRMLLKALLMRSGNEAGRVLALNTIRRRDNRRNIPYNDAERAFSVLMNEKAVSLGATGSNFNNPFGLHSEQHFTTAYDMALIARAFMNEPALAEIARLRAFEGYGSPGEIAEGEVRHYSFINTNQMLPGGPHGHPYVTGVVTGFTGSAGHCFVGAAEHNGVSFISVVMGGTEPARWQDTRRLIDFGFFNFAFREIAINGEIIDTVRIENYRRGEEYTLLVKQAAAHTAFLSRAEYDAISRVITYDPLFESSEAHNGMILLRAPIEEGEVVGRVAYFSGGALLFEAPLIATRTVEERTFDSDMDFYISMVLDNIFTRRALPYWFGFFGTLFGIIGVSRAIVVSRRSGAPETRRRSKYSGR